MKTKYKKNKKKRNVTIKRKHVSTRRRQRGGGYVTNMDDPREFAIRDRAVYNIQEVADSYTFEGRAVAIVSFQTCGTNCQNPPDVTYRPLEGIMIMNDGRTYEGTFDENGNKKHGTLITPDPTGINYKKTTYNGPFEDGKMSGIGQMILEDGSRYTGDFRENVFHGQGRLESSSGDIYDGEWEHDKMHGKGRYTTSDGDIYDGDFVNDTMQGQGILRYKNKNRYEGSFLNDRMHGNGTMYYNDGRRYVGTWKNGNKNNGKLYKPGDKPGDNAAYIHYVNGKPMRL
jgi:hypothetical protein